MRESVPSSPLHPIDADDEEVAGRMEDVATLKLDKVELFASHLYSPVFGPVPLVENEVDSPTTNVDTQSIQIFSDAETELHANVEEARTPPRLKLHAGSGITKSSTTPGRLGRASPNVRMELMLRGIDSEKGGDEQAMREACQAGMVEKGTSGFSRMT